MKRPSRITLFVLSLGIFYGIVLWPLWKSSGSLSVFSSCIPFPHSFSLLYTCLIVRLFSSSVRGIVIGNIILLAASGFVLFRLGWVLCRGRRRLFGTCATLAFFLLNPAILASLTRESSFSVWGVLVALLTLLWFWLSIENWSSFMKSLVLAWAWAIFLWLHIPLAVALALALIPWIIFSRRPLVSLGMGTMMIVLGSALFAFSWLAACGLTHHWACHVWPVVQEELLIQQWARYIRALTDMPGCWRFVGERLVWEISLISPFWFAAGLWHLIARAKKVITEYRAKTVDYVAVLSVILLAADLLKPAPIAQIPLSYTIWVLALWAPLLARELARLPKFYGTGIARIDQVKIVLAGSALIYFMVQDWMLYRG